MVFASFFCVFEGIGVCILLVFMASQSSQSSKTMQVASLSAITPQEVKSKAFKPYMTLLMNAFRNSLFEVVLANDELEFSKSTIGSTSSLIPPHAEGAKEDLG